jgi:hypothetical protein
MAPNSNALLFPSLRAPGFVITVRGLRLVDVGRFNHTSESKQISLNRTAWYPASLPIDDAGALKPNSSRAGFVWYNIETEHGVHRRDLDPTLDEQSNTLVQSLDVDLDQAPSVGDITSYAGTLARFPAGGLEPHRISSSRSG